jgi:putative alpha-1,2-mannosidase
VDPVSGNYVIGTPLFDRATIQLASGKQLVVEARRKSPEDKYIQSVTLNGKPLTKVWFNHSDIANGGTLVFTMDSQPNKQYGADEASAPPSMTV